MKNFIFYKVIKIQCLIIFEISVKECYKKTGNGINDKPDDPTFIFRSHKECLKDYSKSIHYLKLGPLIPPDDKFFPHASLRLLYKTKHP